MQLFRWLICLVFVFSYFKFLLNVEILRLLILHKLITEGVTLLNEIIFLSNVV